MDTNTKVFRNSSPTLGAELSGIFGRNFNDYSGSLFRFPTQYIKEPKPCHITQRPIKTVGGVPTIHLLNTDSVIVSDQLISQFEMEIPPLVADLFISFGNKNPCLASPIRPFDSTGEPLLSHGKQVLRLLEEAGIFNLHALRSRQERLTADIDAHNSAIGREWFERNIFAGKTRIPFATRISSNGNCLDIAFNWAGQPELEPAYLIDSEIFPVKFPTCLLEGEAVIPILTLEAGEPSLAVAIFNSAKEVGIRFVQSLQHLLKYLRAYLTIFGKGYFEFRKLLDLVKARYGAFVLAIDGNTLFKGGIVESATKLNPIISFAEYLGICQKAILKGLFHVSRTVFSIANLGGGVKRAFIPSLKGWASLPANL